MEEEYREVENRPPIRDGELHLLLGDQGDELTHYRRREAAWVSIVVHGIALILLLFLPKWLPRSLVITPSHEINNPVFLSSEEAPRQKPLKTNVISDQDRKAQAPVPDKETLRKALDALRAGRPKPPSPPPQPQAQQQQAQQATPAPPAQGSVAPPEPPATQQAQLQAPKPKQNPFAIQSAGSSVEQAIHSAASNGPSTTYNNSGDYGSGLHPHVDRLGDMAILSDTHGVDFGPYMQRLHVTVQDHWDPLIPEIAYPPTNRKGVVVIEFAIMKDGTIQGMKLVASSGDTAMDRAAWGALTSAIPLPKLPTEYSEPYLVIRAAFFYNPDKKDFQ